MLEALGFDRSIFVILAVFPIAYWIIRTFFVAPLIGVLDEREATAESAQELFDRTAAETEARLEEQRSQMAEARQRARERREEIRREASERRRSVLAEAKSEADRMAKEAGAQLAAQVEAEKTTLEERSRQLAGSVVERLVGRRT